jgi:hypothetical protein
MPARATPDEPMAGGGNNDDLLPLLLEICEDFFAGANSTTRDQVDTVLQAHGITGGPGWLIDMLGLTRQRLPRPPQPARPGFAAC